MCKPLVALLLVALAAPGMSARAQALSGPYEFVCDAPAAHFSGWRGAFTSDAVEVTGFIQLIERRQDLRYPAAASVLLYGPGGDSAVGLQILVEPDDPGVLKIAVRGPKGADKLTVITTRSSNAGPLAFTVSVTKPGYLNVTAERVTRTVKLGDFKAQKLGLSCSTGTFKFTSILITP